MSIRARYIYDGLQSITTGVDSGRSPALLDRNQLAWGLNVTTRGGFITCRPGIASVDLTFLDETGEVDTTVETAFKTGGRFQGAWPYISDAGLDYIVASIGGRIFLIDCQTRNVQDLSTLSGLTNRSDAPRVWFVQAENFLIIQNASDAALIYDGSNLRRSGGDAAREVPPGSVMEYNNGRLWVASPDGVRFVAGDLAYSVTGQRRDVLGFTENTYLNGGGFFAVPSNAGPITAMRSIAVQDNPTGQGPLIIFTTRGAFAVNAPFNRDDWQNTRSPIVTITLQAAGAVSQASTTLVNGDIWFRSFDGSRSFVWAQRDHGTWVNTPLSREVSRALDFDSPSLLPYASAILFDNRWLCTTQPSQALEDGAIRGVTHAALTVLDFTPVSQMFNRSQPVWDGIWTGLDFLQVLTTQGANTRAFAFALNNDSEVTLWEFSHEARFDGNTRIQWAFETPSYGFDTGGWSLRELLYYDLWADRLAGDLGFTMRYREDGYPFWRTWHQWEDCALIDDCSHAACSTPANSQEQYRPRVRGPLADATCDAITLKPSNQFYRAQVRFECVGFARIRQLRLVARDVPEETEGSCV